MAALIQCHECMVRYSFILRFEFKLPCPTGNRGRKLHEKDSYLQPTLIYGGQNGGSGRPARDSPAPGPRTARGWRHPAWAPLDHTPVTLEVGGVSSDGRGLTSA